MMHAGIFGRLGPSRGGFDSEVLDGYSGPLALRESVA